jgi:CRISPR/Cas system CSM-associated protein Csm3 (group 7 of RAMP superfamily)
MAREISHTLILEGQLEATEPLHVGGADSSHESDMALAVDGLGRYYLPGSSLAGAIRAWDGAAEEDALWGFSASGDQGHASHILIDDAPTEGGALPELWHGVGIDRVTATAAEGIKFDRQVLPAGTRFAFRLQLEIPKKGGLDAGRIWMAQLRDALLQGRIPLGAGTTRGLGRVRLDQRADLREINWTSRSKFLAALESKAVGERAPQPWHAKDPKPSNEVVVRVHWQPLGPVMSKAGRDGSAVAALPFTAAIRTAVNGGESQRVIALPGSSIKGALRVHAERIMRTVLGLQITDNASHLDQVNVPLVSQLFGIARPSTRTDTDPAKAPSGGKGWLRVPTIFSDIRLPVSQWEALAEQPEAWTATGWNRDGEKRLYRADHVAIDRWTGAAADGLLFSGVEPAASAQWDPIELRFHTPAGADRKAAFALLWLVLRDLCDGRIPLGYACNRGYGALNVSQLRLEGLGLLGLVDAQLALPVSDRRIDESRAELLVTALKGAWVDWLARQASEIAA